MTQTAPTKTEIDEKSRTLAGEVLDYLIGKFTPVTPTTQTSSTATNISENSGSENSGSENNSEEQTGGDIE